MRDLPRKATEQAKTAHSMESIPPDMLSKIKSPIHDEGEAKVTKSWRVEVIELGCETSGVSRFTTKQVQGPRSHLSLFPHYRAS
jgi:hypothetical protein